MIEGSSLIVLFCSGHRAATFSVCFEFLYYQKLSYTLLYLTYLAVTKVATSSVKYKHHRTDGTVQHPYGLSLLIL